MKYILNEQREQESWWAKSYEWQPQSERAVNILKTKRKYTLFYTRLDFKQIKYSNAFPALVLTVFIKTTDTGLVRVTCAFIKK